MKLDLFQDSELDILHLPKREGIFLIDESNPHLHSLLAKDPKVRYPMALYENVEGRFIMSSTHQDWPSTRSLLQRLSWVRNSVINKQAYLELHLYWGAQGPIELWRMGIEATAFLSEFLFSVSVNNEFEYSNELSKFQSTELNIFKKTSSSRIILNHMNCRSLM